MSIAHLSLPSKMANSCPHLKNPGHTPQISEEERLIIKFLWSHPVGEMDTYFLDVANAKEKKGNYIVG